MSNHFEFRTNGSAEVDFDFECPRFRNERLQLSPGAVMTAGLGTKVAAEAEASRTIRRICDTNNLSYDAAFTEFLTRARQNPEGREATLLAISAAGVLSQINHPATHK